MPGVCKAGDPDDQACLEAKPQWAGYKCEDEMDHPEWGCHGQWCGLRLTMIGIVQRLHTVVSAT